MSSQASETMEQTALLVKLCVKVLKNAAPRGMTTKELAAALEYEQTKGFNGISSSILSSKLNAVFRRVHSDSPRPSQKQLANLPLTRNPSTDVPRRLVYRYTPPESNLDNEELLRSEDSDESSSGDEESEPRTPKDNSDSEDGEKSRKRKHSFSLMSSPGRKSRSEGLKSKRAVTGKAATIDENTTENTTPKTSEDGKNKEDAKIPLQRRPYVSMQLKYTPPKVNLYYDMIGFDTLNLAVNEKTKGSAVFSNPEETVLPLHGEWEFQNPESLPLNDLDNFVI